MCLIRRVQFKTVDDLKAFLDEQAGKYNTLDFIESDPISIPHMFSRREDIEIAGLFSAVLAWGQRKTILSKMNELLLRMDKAPFDFVGQHSSQDLKNLEGFVHRTFNDTDLLYFIVFLKELYSKEGGLEAAFFPQKDNREDAVFHALTGFRDLFVSSEYFPKRTGKHISRPQSGSACKRLNMFLRWMVRKDNAGVDFGIWNSIKPAQLICPCDVHVERQARILGLVSRPKPDWTMAIELTERLKQFDPEDPVRYDFALFGMGVN
jgi:uncharacterized protein (TIGR02757 family)